MFSGKPEELKVLMSQLLVGELFDAWEVVEAKAETFFEIAVNGRMKKGFFDEPEAVQREFVLWKDVKDFFYRMVKGKRLPGMLRIVLRAGAEQETEVKQKQGIREEGISFLLNIRFENGACQLVSGVSHTQFSLDKSADIAWDTELQEFFKQNQIIVSTH